LKSRFPHSEVLKGTFQRAQFAQRLAGVLNVTAISDFSTVAQSAIWRLINYSGTLFRNGVTIGSVPPLTSWLSFEVDTGTAGQVNLVVVPEPATLVGLIAGGLGIAASRRFRNRR
jgi:hypothetical protein